MDSVLQARSVSKHYSGHAAVTGVTFEVPRGSCFALVGPSGCGKTTTLRMVAGFDEPDQGEILLNGTRLNGLPPYRRNVSTVFQNYALFPHLTARGNIEFGLRRQPRAAPDIDARVRAVLELVQLSGKEHRKPAQLSGGEKQRVALARSLVIEPDVLLLDEPLSALDPILRKQVRAELRMLQRRSGTTFVIVTHDQEEALSLADNIAVMNRGRIEQIGPPEALYLKPGTRFVASFLGAVNWVGEVGLRPESTKISHAPPANGDRSVPARIESAMFLGNCFHVAARLETGAAIIAEVPRQNGGYAAGQPVHVCWHPADEMTFPA